MILSTDSELIAYTCINEPGLHILHRPPELCEDNVASIPVFQHILENFPSDLHLNYNCNFPNVMSQSLIEVLKLLPNMENLYQFLMLFGIR